MSVPPAADGADAGPGSTGADPTTEPRGSRTGLVVGLLLAAALVLGAVWFFFLRDDAAEERVATPTPSASVSPTPTPTPEPTPTPTPTQTQAPEEPVQLRADGIGPLELRMTAEQAVATGAVTQQQTAGLTELIPDPATFPGVFVGYDPTEDQVFSFLVKDDSPITTPDGIGVTSTPADVVAAYGPLVQERTEAGETWQVVPVDDVGYAFFPDGEGGLILVAATDTVLADLKPGQGLF